MVCFFSHLVLYFEKKNYRFTSQKDIKRHTQASCFPFMPFGPFLVVLHRYHFYQFVGFTFSIYFHSYVFFPLHALLTDTINTILHLIFSLSNVSGDYLLSEYADFFHQFSQMHNTPLSGCIILVNHSCTEELLSCFQK